MIKVSMSRSGRIILKEDGLTTDGDGLIHGGVTYKLSLHHRFANQVVNADYHALRMLSLRMLERYDLGEVTGDNVRVLKRGKVQ